MSAAGANKYLESAGAGKTTVKWLILKIKICATKTYSPAQVLVL